MGLLDYADAARKKLAGLLGDMPLVQMMQGRAEAPTQAGLLGALKAMPVFSPDAGQSAYDAALNIGPMGLGKIVYHGSPHKFDKFDASKIGTGEGAQAYGHGIYLADAEKVAKEYQTTLSARKDIARNSAYQNAQIAKKYAEKWERMLKDPSIPRPLSAATKQPVTDDYLRKQIEDELAESARHTKWIEESNPGGALYKADLPDEWIPKMLDWDKPLKDQAEVLGALQNSGYLDEARKAGGFYESDIASGLMEGRHLLPAKPSAGGREIAEKLRRAGIPGIRYLDGGSRGKGQGSYNYVVFPGLEDQVKILERNGAPLGLLGGN